MKLYENGKYIADYPSVASAKRAIEGLDYSMACVDCDPQEYVLKDADGKEVYRRPRIYVP